MTASATRTSTATSTVQHRSRQLQEQQEDGEGNNDASSTTSSSALSKIEQNTNYVADVYEPPSIVAFVGTALDTTSGAGGTDALAFLGSTTATTREAQVQYVKSLTGLGSFFIVFSVLWFLTLWLLKRQGRSKVGCAAGYAFHDSDSDSETIVEERRQRLAKDSADNKLQWGDDEDVSVGAAYDGGESVIEDAYPVNDDEHKQSGDGIAQRIGLAACVLGRESGTRDDRGINRNKNRNSAAPSARAAAVIHARDDDSVSMMTDDKNMMTMMSNNISQYSNNNDHIIDDDDDDIDSHIYRYDGDMSAIDGMLESQGAPYDDDYNVVDDRSDYIPRGRYSQQAQSHTQQQQQQQQQQTLRSIPKQRSAFEQPASASASHSSQRCFSGCCSWDPDHVRRRKFRTRFAYGFFSIVSLLCCFLLLVTMYAPLEHSAMTTSSVVQEAKGIISEVNDVLAVLDTATTVTQDILRQQSETDFSSLCPDITSGEFSSAFGFDPDSIISTINEEYERYGTQAAELLATASDAVDSVAALLEGIDGPVQKANEYLWVVPLLICCTALVIFATLGLMTAVAWRERKVELMSQTDVPKIEDCYGFSFLPLLIVVCLLSWVLVILCCFGTVIITDTCVVGSPDETILTIVQSQNLDDEVFRRLETYINGCMGPDPLQDLVMLQGLLHETLGFVDERLQLADEIGYGALEEICGPGNSVRPFFNDVKSLQNEVVNVNDAIQSAYYALECPRINTLYNQVAHEALCTDFATANVNGFLLFLFGPAISGLVLISLRASWRTAAGV